MIAKGVGRRSVIMVPARRSTRLLRDAVALVHKNIRNLLCHNNEIALKSKRELYCCFVFSTRSNEQHSPNKYVCYYHEPN